MGAVYISIGCATPIYGFRPYAGMSNKQIGRKLGISDGTVKIYVKNLLQKLSLHSRLELAAWVHSGASNRPEERH